MSFLDRINTRETKSQAYASTWSDDRWASAPKRSAPIWIAGMLVVATGILVYLSVLLFQTTWPSQVMSEPSVGSSPTESASQSPAPPTQALASPPPSRGRPRVATPAPEVVAAPTVDDGQPAVPLAEVRVDTASDITATPEPSGESFRELAPAASTDVYSAENLDVTPPQPISHSWFNELPGGLQSARGVTIEFIVNAQGVVESARVRGEARSLGESMLFAMSLHALKTWQFRPALRDGKAVRYRASKFFGGFPVEPPAQN